MAADTAVAWEAALTELTASASARATQLGVPPALAGDDVVVRLAVQAGLLLPALLLLLLGACRRRRPKSSVVVPRGKKGKKGKGGAASS